MAAGAADKVPVHTARVPVAADFLSIGLDTEVLPPAQNCSRHGSPSQNQELAYVLLGRTDHPKGNRTKPSLSWLCSG